MESDRYDLVIRNASVIDGTGQAARFADVAIRGDRIAAVGTVPEGAGAPVLDAAGLTLSPGFIDVHTHDDFAVVLYPEMPFKVLQGVTTVVVGNCGFGPAPHAAASSFAQSLHPEESIPAWQGYGGYMGRLEQDPPSLNVGVLVAHGTLRQAVLGSDARPPTDSELDQLREGVREGLAAGALGVSSGLIYDPGRHATTDELVAVASELHGTGALYATHMRNEAEALQDALHEAIEIGERAGVPVQISHLKAAGRENWGRGEEALELIEAAQARGLDVTADQYPYTSGSTMLSAILQNEEMRASVSRWAASIATDVTLASAPKHPEWEGQTLEELSATLGLSVEETAERVVAEEGSTATVVIRSMDEGDVRTVLRHPYTMIGSDGLPTLKGKPHPRLYGTFPRVLGRYVRELGLLSIEEAVHRMTGLPAGKFRLPGRGVVRPGALADLVLFDPATIIDVGTYEDPQRPPTGIAHVFVNGVGVVRDGSHTGARPGRPIGRA
jgi:N-acyl-D-aspartate/D-glutamate deacylase